MRSLKTLLGLLTFITLPQVASAASSNDQQLIFALGYGPGYYLYRVPAGTTTNTTLTSSGTELVKGIKRDLAIMAMWRPTPNFGLGLNYSGTTLFKGTFGALDVETSLNFFSIEPRLFMGSNGWFQLGAKVGSATISTEYKVFGFTIAEGTSKLGVAGGPVMAMDWRFTNPVSLGLQFDGLVGATDPLSYAGIVRIMLKLWI